MIMSELKDAQGWKGLRVHPVQYCIPQLSATYDIPPRSGSASVRIPPVTGHSYFQRPPCHHQMLLIMKKF
jgi:hypothetical protein